MRLFLASGVLAAALALLTGILGGSSTIDLSNPRNGEASIAADPFGMAHISAVNSQSATLDASRYRQAREAGANWNRWVFYWHEIEPSPGNANYAPQETVVNQDVANGYRFKIDAVLMGTPSWATGGEASASDFLPPPPRVGERRFNEVAAETTYTGPSVVTRPPQSLDQSVFDDGSDLPGAGKGINQRNYWARFVYGTVSRFKDRVRHWEIWNEPDYLPSDASGWYGFWSGSADQYYRLLKVAYLAAKAADPGATVLMGGMAYWPEIQQQHLPPLTFFKRVLALANADPLAAGNNRFFDASAWHWYNRSNQSYYKMRDVRSALSSYGLGSKPVWINETGMPAWNDPARSPSGLTPYFGSGTLTEQASFVIQSMAYALAAGVERTLVFQEYDDGNGEAFGLMRNDGPPRPAYYAFQLAARYLTGTYSATLGEQGPVTVVKAFTSSNNRVVALWNNGPTPTQVAVGARAGSATLLRQPTEANPVGTQQIVYPSAGQYVISLPGATDNNGVTSSDYIVGGLVALLVENGVSSPDPATPTPQPRIVPTGLIANGRFEQDFAEWTLGYLPAQIAVAANGGKQALLGANFQAQDGLGGANSTLSQNVTLPGQAPALRLRFSYLLNTSQPWPGNLNDAYSYDKFEVLVIDAYGLRHTLLTDWTGKSWFAAADLDLRSYAGQTVSLVFNLWQSAATADYPTTVYLDDVTLWPYSVPLDGRKNAGS